MNKQLKHLTFDDLHRKLDELTQQKIEPGNSNEIKRLLHELQVHQIELEMQNRELRESQIELEGSRDRYANLYDFAPIGFLTLDDKGKILELNLTAAEFLGQPRGQLLNTSILNHVISTDTQHLKQYLAQVVKSPEQEKVKIEVTFKNTAHQPENLRFESVVSSLGKEDKKVVRCAVLDITEQVIARDKLNDRLRQAAKVFDSTLEGIVITDANFNITAVNLAFTHLTGYSESWVIGKDFRKLQIEQEDKYFYQKCWESLSKRGHWQGEILNQKVNNEYFTALESVSAVCDNREELTNYVIVFSDITYIRQSQERLNFLAYHDPLTDLPNRTHFNIQLEHAVQRAKRNEYQLAILFLDLDRFKNINDTLGHKAGDILLQEMSKRLKNNLREEDTVARLGGDEFVILLDSINHVEDAALLAEKLIEAIAQPLLIGSHQIVVSTSVGISVYPDDASNTDDLVKSADIAMYHAKHSGKNTYRFYSPELTAKAFEHLAIEHGLREALSNHELKIFYQPIVSLITGKTQGVEALLRWNHPLKGQLKPNEFIEIAEETGLICDIGKWVIREVCRQWKIWQKAGVPPLTLAINVSVRQILFDSLADNIIEICDDEKLALDKLNIELEITESVLQEVEKNLESLNRLHDIGVRLSVDDFGTGYSSLSKLKHFPIDTIKIDRSFVHDLPENADSRAIVTAIMALAKTMKINVVAEGVELASQRDYLKGLGCDLAQGFYFNEALPPAVITRFFCDSSINDSAGN